MINNLWKGIQQSLILDRVNSDLIEISFWGKIDADDTSIAERQDVRGKKCSFFIFSKPYDAYHMLHMICTILYCGPYNKDQIML